MVDNGIPTGIEQLLAMAAVDPGFAEALERDRAAAIAASEVRLTATEQGILHAVHDIALRRMTDSVGFSLSEQDRRSFLGRSAAALVALLGVTTQGCQSPIKGTRPDPVTPPPIPDATSPTPDARSATPDATRPRPPTPIGIGGLQATRPRPPTPIPIGGLQATRPDASSPPPSTTGIRPDRPRPTRGIRPDRP